MLFSFDYRFSKYAHKYIKDYQKTEAHRNNLSFFDKIQEQKEEKESAACAADVTEKLEHLNAEDLAKIKEKLAELEEKQKNCDCES